LKDPLPAIFVVSWLSWLLGSVDLLCPVIFIHVNGGKKQTGKVRVITAWSKSFVGCLFVCLFVCFCIFFAISILVYLVLLQRKPLI
jgi:hypothetical protein